MVQAHQIVRRKALSFDYYFRLSFAGLAHWLSSSLPSWLKEFDSPIPLQTNRLISVISFYGKNEGWGSIPCLEAGAALLDIYFC